MDTTKLLIIIAILICGTTSYFAYQTSQEVNELKAQAQVTEKKVDSLLQAPAKIAKSTRNISGNNRPQSFWEALLSEIEEEQKQGQEQFRFNKIEHTRKPNVSQFEILLERSMITVDLLLVRPKVDLATGKLKKFWDAVSFKIKKSAMGLFFPQGKFYTFLGTHALPFQQHENLKIF